MVCVWVDKKMELRYWWENGNAKNLRINELNKKGIKGADLKDTWNFVQEFCSLPYILTVGKGRRLLYVADNDLGD